VFGPTEREWETRDQAAFYADLLSRYGGALPIAQLVRQQEDGTTQSFEQRLAGYANHRSENLRRRYLDVPWFLSDLFYRITEQNAVGAGAYTQLVSALVEESSDELLFLSLNYDTLLERSLQALSGWHPETMSDYTSGRVAVVKPHGSIDWVHDISDLAPGDWSVEKIRQAPVRLIGAGGPVLTHWPTFHTGKKAVAGYPAITAPIARKSAEQAVCPPAHLTFARQFIAEADRLLVIGASGLDEDLIEWLSCARRLVQFTLVDFSPSSDARTLVRTWERYAFACSVALAHASHVVHRNGFRRFASGPALQTFVSGQDQEGAADFARTYRNLHAQKLNPTLALSAGLGAGLGVEP